MKNLLSAILLLQFTLSSYAQKDEGTPQPPGDQPEVEQPQEQPLEQPGGQIVQPGGMDQTGVQQGGMDQSGGQQQAFQQGPGGASMQPPGGQRYAQGRGRRFEGGNYSCPLNDMPPGFSQLRTDTTNLLQEIETLEQNCRRAGQQDNIQSRATGRVSQALGALRSSNPEQADCVRPEAAVARTNEGAIEYLNARGAVEVAADQVPRNAPYPADAPGWKQFTGAGGLSIEIESYRTSCMVQGSQGTYYINTQCMLDADDVAVDRARTSGTFGNTRQRVCGPISPQLAEALQTAITAATELMGREECDAGPAVASNVLNIGAGLLSMIPMSPILSQVAQLGVSLFQGIFGGGGRPRSTVALERIQRNGTMRGAQCLYMHLHRQQLRCGSAQAADELQGVTAQRAALGDSNGLGGTLENLARAYASSNNGETVERANERCRAQGSARSNPNEVVQSWDLAAIDTALTAENKTLDSVSNALRAPCQAFTRGEAGLRELSHPPLTTAVQAMSNLCQVRRTATDVAQVEAAFRLNGRGLHTVFADALEDVPARPAVASADPCFNNPQLVAYNVAKRQFDDLLAQEQRLREQGGTARGNGNLSLDELFANFQYPLISNDTSVNLTKTLQFTAEGGRPGQVSSLRQFCLNGQFDSPGFLSTVNELQAICLLNAGAYLHTPRSATVPDFGNDNADTWRSRCSYFLSNPRLSPQPAASPSTYANWQCQAINEFDSYRAALPSGQELFNGICGNQFQREFSRRVAPGATRR